MNHSKGFLFALAAACCNSSIGVVNRWSFLVKLDYFQVAFFKCFIAFCILSAGALFFKKIRQEILALCTHIKPLLVLAFFGVFLLYIFETKAFSIIDIPTVAFTVYATGIVTIFLGHLFLKEDLTKKKLWGAAFVVIGEISILGGMSEFDYSNMLGIAYAFIGGLGYSFFIFFCRKYKLNVNFGFLWWVTGLGTILLLLYAVLNNLTIGNPLPGLHYVTFLALGPTLGGFYFTAKALQFIDAGRVQIIEMSDPFFALLFAFLFFGEVISLSGFLGVFLILIGLNTVRKEA